LIRIIYTASDYFLLTFFAGGLDFAVFFAVGLDFEDD
jgi:hypothetical protein